MNKQFMRTIIFTVNFIILAAVVSSCAEDSPEILSDVEASTDTATDNTNWQLIWSDEFEGTSLNNNNWKHEIGRGSSGWGNNEWQYYQADNTSVADGILTIEARSEAVPDSGQAYTSSRIVTEGLQSFQFGKVEIRAKLPEGQGIWPALWMLGANFPTAGWPFSGEIDIMEMIGGQGRENTVHGTIHYDDGGHTYTGGSGALASGTFADSFHVFSIEWTSTEIRWLVDGQQFHSENISSASRSELRAPFFFIFNVAVGGNWPGYPDQTTSFPQRMEVDYIRVYEAQ